MFLCQSHDHHHRIHNKHRDHESLRLCHALGNKQHIHAHDEQYCQNPEHGISEIELDDLLRCPRFHEVVAFHPPHSQECEQSRTEEDGQWRRHRLLMIAMAMSHKMRTTRATTATVSTYLKAPETFRPKSVSNVTPTMTQMPACLIFFKRVIDRRCSLSEACQISTQRLISFFFTSTKPP